MSSSAGDLPNASGSASEHRRSLRTDTDISPRSRRPTRMPKPDGLPRAGANRAARAHAVAMVPGTRGGAIIDGRRQTDPRRINVETQARRDHARSRTCPTMNGACPDQSR